MDIPLLFRAAGIGLYTLYRYLEPTRLQHLFAVYEGSDCPAQQLRCPKQDISLACVIGAYSGDNSLAQDTLDVGWRNFHSFLEGYAPAGDFGFDPRDS